MKIYFEKDFYSKLTELGLLKRNDSNTFELDGIGIYNMVGKDLIFSIVALNEDKVCMQSTNYSMDKSYFRIILKEDCVVIENFHLNDRKKHNFFRNIIKGNFDSVCSHVIPHDIYICAMENKDINYRYILVCNSDSIKDAKYISIGD